MTEPKVSVVLPTFRRGHLLVRALESLRWQSFSDFECLIVNNDREDDLAKTVEQFHEPRFCHLVEKRRGVAYARNTGISFSTGRYVAFLDDDDYWFPEKLNRQVVFLDRNLFFSGIAECRNPGNRGNLLMLRDLFLDNSIVTSSMMVRRGALLECGEFDQSYAPVEDYEYWIRLCSSHAIRMSDDRDTWYDTTLRDDRASLDLSANFRQSARAIDRHRRSENIDDRQITKRVRSLQQVAARLRLRRVSLGKLIGSIRSHSSHGTGLFQKNS